MVRQTLRRWYKISFSDFCKQYEKTDEERLNEFTPEGVLRGIRAAIKTAESSYRHSSQEVIFFRDALVSLKETYLHFGGKIEDLEKQDDEKE